MGAKSETGSIAGRLWLRLTQRLGHFCWTDEGGVDDSCAEGEVDSDPCGAMQSGGAGGCCTRGAWLETRRRKPSSSDDRDGFRTHTNGMELRS